MGKHLLFMEYKIVNPPQAQLDKSLLTKQRILLKDHLVQPYKITCWCYL